MAVKMRLIGGEWDVKMAPENEGIGTTLATSIIHGYALLLDSGN